MSDDQASARREIEDALRELDRSEQAFETQMRAAEENFVLEMAKAHREFADGLAQARAECHEALRKLG